MGVHSGPVSGVIDVNDHANLAGAGLNMAQRVMDCGDAGHILVSKHTAEDLEAYDHWRPVLHDLGTCEVKHGVRVSVTNLYSDEVGNPQLPSKLHAVRKHRAHVRWAAVAVALLVLGAIVGGTFFFSHRPTTSALRVLDKSIAVLPFENLSEEKANAFFADGVQDEILTDLAKIADLKVISRTSVLQYKSGIARNLRDIGQQLGVAHLLEGSVQRAGNRVRVNAQLIDARTDRHLWAQTYDRDLADIFAIQSEIAKMIVDQLRAKLSPQERAALASRPTQDTEAYDLYLRAKELMHGTSSYEPASVNVFSDSVKLLEKAVARDPNFFLAYCLLAEANLSLHWRYESVIGARERAEVALQAARRLAPEAGEMHLAEARFFYWGKRDYDHALESLEKAARSSPNSADIFRFTALVERRLGRWAESIRHELRAVELDPLDWHPRDELISTYLLVRNYNAAERLADHAIADFPDRADYFRAIKAEAAFDRGDLKAARACLATLSVPDYSAWQLWGTAMYERNYEEAARLLNLWTERRESDDALVSRSWMEALTARAAGKSESARSAFLSARQHYAAIPRSE
jgi:Predicted integral membrane protein